MARCIHFNSFLRELREVAPEIELFLENHSPCEKYFVAKLLYLQTFQLAILQKILYLEEYVRKVARHIFLTETLSRTLHTLGKISLRNCSIPTIKFSEVL